ncbi:histidine kinase [uncultured Williamsia sp.]|uniref:sensor histidine kinase n=1 Tax=uncultured Williamsia sp. TaxID=259311 RepID=UPI00262955B9|nr:histidine kinase [uncultured Williamsia sp.]
MRRIPWTDGLLGVAAVAAAAVGWVAAVAGDRGAHGCVAAACFTAAAFAVPVRRTALWPSAAATALAFAVLGATGSASALGVFPLILCVPLTVSAVTGHAEHRWQGRAVLVVACLATPLSPAVSISASRPFAIGLHVAVLLAVHLWSSRRRLQREVTAAEQARAVELATLTERQRIAADLHDGLGHALTAIRAKASTSVALARTRPETATEALTVISDLSRESLVELRRAVGEISGTASGFTDSPAQILDRARRIGREVRCTTPSGTTVEDVDASLADDVRATVRRVLQEAITNAVRHAPPDAPVDVDVTVDDDARTMTLRVHNIVATGATPPGAGHGCDTMRRRAADVGGRCTVGPDGDGWTVTLEVPVGRRS